MKEHKVDVFLDDRHVGTLAETAGHRVGQLEIIIKYRLYTVRNGLV